MTQGELTYLIMVIGAMTTFAVALAYGSWVASGKPRTAVEAFPQKSSAAGQGALNAGTKEAA